jgi:hypothetical protein
MPIKLSQIRLFALCALLCLWAATAYAGWSDNMRLSYRGNEISPQVIARNDTVHVVWYQINGNVSYIRSTDGGNTWGSVVNINVSHHKGFNSNLNLAEHGLLVSWYDDDSLMNVPSIGIRKSSNGGATWGAPSYVWTDNPTGFGLPLSAVKGDSIFLSYYTSNDDSTGHCPFRALHSYDYGATWSDEVTIGHPYVLEGLPMRMIYCQGAIVMAWTGMADSTRPNETHIYGFRSTDGGRSWSPPIWISPDSPDWSVSVCLACNPQTGQLAASYLDFRYFQYAFHGDVFTAFSDDGGLTWPVETQVTSNHTAIRPQIDFAGDTLVAVWSDIQFNLYGDEEIVFNRSNDGGFAWRGEERLTESEGQSGAPAVSFDKAKVHVVWEESVPHGTYDIYYKRFTPDTTDNIEEPIASPPNAVSLSAYPNPFNSTTTIIVTQDAPIFIYDITGRLISTLYAEDGGAVWDASAFSSGIYFAKAVVSNNSNIVKLLYLK